MSLTGKLTLPSSPDTGRLIISSTELDADNMTRDLQASLSPSQLATSTDPLESGAVSTFTDQEESGSFTGKH